MASTNTRTYPEDLRRDLEATLTAAVEYIIHSRDQQGHWGDVRSTAVATWAIAELMSERHQAKEFPELGTILEDAHTWLAGQAKREDGGVSWESEGWDTSLGVLSLTFSDKFGERRDQATAWLQRIRCPSSGVWYDEIWETILCAVAILRAETARANKRQSLTPLFKSILNWLNSLPSKSSGEFINAHYSGFVAWLLAEILGSYLQRDLIRSVELTTFTEKVDAAVDWLLRTAASDPNSLWSPYTFANAYITYGLSKLSRYRAHDVSYVPAVVSWFRGQQGQSGAYEDTEDTGLAILALSQLLEQLHITPASLLQQITYVPVKELCPVRKCFIGYSSKSNSVALEVKEFLGRMLPDLVIRDWKWDFQPGQILFSEIESASRECHAALFLVTKDDQISGSDRLFSSPRDNIVFEVGFFAARLGMLNTVLVVEQGTKLPTDWGGILYISLPNRSDISAIHTPLLLSMKRILAL